jgi:hypothetical protein
LTPLVSPAICAKRRSQLEAAAARIDHYSGRRGAWVEFAAGIVLGWRAGELGPFCSEPPRSLGALAVELRREANTRRYGALTRRRGGRIRVFASAVERQKVKRWRAEVRAAERQFPGAGRNLKRPRDA